MEKKEIRNSLFYPFENMVMSLYLFVMLGFFPLFYKYQYAKMGDGKYQIFFYSTLICLGSLLLCLILRAGINGARGFAHVEQNITQNIAKKKQWKLSFLDKGVLLYFFCATISYLFSAFKKDGFFGADGWYMGYLSQVLFVGIYLAVSVMGRHYRVWISLLMVSSALVFLVALFHRFDVDILHIYGDLELYYKVQFLSTIGQASWYCGFMCAVFPIGLYVFYAADNGNVRLAAGLYSVLAMCTLVTQNTDSAYLSLAAIIILLFYLSFDGKRETLRFLSVLVVIFASFTFMGLIQRVFAQHAIPLDSMSVFMSRSAFSPLMLLLSLLGYVWVKRKLPDGRDWKGRRRAFWMVLILTGSLLFVGVVFVVFNSTGVLYSHFGYENVDNYLFFSDDWGNRRGFAWRLCCEMYGELPFLKKLIGVGPECYSVYAQSVPEYGMQIRDYWGNLSLTNAHNEYLTKLLNLGIVGLSAYVFLLGSGVHLFVKFRKKQVLLPAFALCILSYGTYLVFCYEQVCCTPFIYFLMGFGNFIIKEEK